MIVSVTWTSTPRAMMGSASAASIRSITKTSMSPAATYRRATPRALGSSPRLVIILSAGPRKALPPTMPETPTPGTPRARAAVISASSPGTARMGPMETIGLEGARTMASAVRKASRTSAVTAASSAPANRTSRTSGSW